MILILTLIAAILAVSIVAIRVQYNRNLAKKRAFYRDKITTARKFTSNIPCKSCTIKRMSTPLACITCEDYKNWVVSSPLILDVGCGGNYSVGCGKQGEDGFRHSTIKSDVQIDIRIPLTKTENFVLASAEALPFKDNAFRIAESFDVLEHVNSPFQMVSEMKRVSRRLLLVTPNSLHLPSTLMSIIRKDGCYLPHGDHVQTWSKAEMTGLLRRVGYTFFEVGFSDFHVHKQRLITRLILRFVPFPPVRYRALVVTARKETV